MKKSIDGLIFEAGSNQDDIKKTIKNDVITRITNFIKKKVNIDVTAKIDSLIQVELSSDSKTAKISLFLNNTLTDEIESSFQKRGKSALLHHLDSFIHQQQDAIKNKTEAFFVKRRGWLFQNALGDQYPLAQADNVTYDIAIQEIEMLKQHASNVGSNIQDVEKKKKLKSERDRRLNTYETEKLPSIKNLKITSKDLPHLKNFYEQLQIEEDASKILQKIKGVLMRYNISGEEKEYEQICQKLEEEKSSALEAIEKEVSEINNLSISFDIKEKTKKQLITNLNEKKAVKKGSSHFAVGTLIGSALLIALLYFFSPKNGSQNDKNAPQTEQKVQDDKEVPNGEKVMNQHDSIIMQLLEDENKGPVRKERLQAEQINDLVNKMAIDQEEYKKNQQEWNAQISGKVSSEIKVAAEAALKFIIPEAIGFMMDDSKGLLTQFKKEVKAKNISYKNFLKGMYYALGQNYYPKKESNFFGVTTPFVMLPYAEMKNCFPDDPYVQDPKFTPEQLGRDLVEARVSFGIPGVNMPKGVLLQ